MKRRKIYLLLLLPVLLFATVTAIIVENGAETVSVSAIEVPGSARQTLVLDPGHGGLDGGAVSSDGTAESGLNLEIAQKTRDLARLFGDEPVMTRESEQLDYPESEQSIHAKKVWDQKRRVEQINAAECGVLISIHQNKYPDPRPSGTQVFYGKTSGSAELGVLLHENLTQCLCPDNRRVAAPISESIYLMKNVSCPAVLVECGFLSNRAETELLRSDEYQKKLALILYISYLQYIR